MRMPDVNVLVYAFNKDAPGHERYAKWLAGLAGSDEPFALSELVLQGFIRLVTHPKVLQPPATLTEAFGFVDELLECPNATLMRPGPGHFELFRQLCASGRASGNLVSDAAHAALAIESGCVWCSADTDFKRFEPMLRWEYV